MTTARELCDWITENKRLPKSAWPEDVDTILRALDLLARVEESRDELVQHLCENSEDQAAARIILQLERIVALQAESAELAGELAELQDRQIPKLIAERDKLKAHAEEFAQQRKKNYSGLYWSHPGLEDAYATYRRDFPHD